MKTYLDKSLCQNMANMFYINKAIFFIDITCIRILKEENSRENIMYSYNLNNYKLSFGKSVPVKTFQNVSKPFVDEINRGLSQVPSSFFKQIKNGNILDDIRVAPKASDSVPEFPSIQREFKKDFIPGTKITYDDDTIGIAFTRFDKHGKKLISSIGFFESPKKGIKSDVNRGSVIHEITHKIDELFLRLLGFRISHTESFKEAVKKDLKKLPEKKKLHQKLFYEKWSKTSKNNTLQGITSRKLVLAGLEEIFAECGAANITGTKQEIKIRSKYISVFLPESYKYVKKLFYLLGMR